MSGERAGTPGANWETGLVPTGERFVPDGEPEPAANRAARRAAARGRKRSDALQASRSGPSGLQEAREAACTPVCRTNSPPPSTAKPYSQERQRGAQPADPKESTYDRP